MRWNDDASAAMAKAPLIIRRMITKRVEKSVREQGRETVTLADVEQLQAKAMGGAMSDQKIEEMVRSSRPQVYRDERTYEVRVCNLADCPRALYDVRPVAEKMAQVIENSRLPEAVVRRASGPILRHHRLSVSISGCPNSCSQPQIADFGVQGRARPITVSDNCIGCGECVRVCNENAIVVSDNEPVIDRTLCVNCGDCAEICPTQAIITGEHGFSVLIGGKLGRHPKLARTLFDFADEKTLLNSLQVCCDVFADEMQPGERLANAVDRIGVLTIAHRCVS